VFTLVEFLKPLVTFAGEASSLFLIGITKDLKWYYSYPLFFMIGIIILPLVVYFLSLVTFLCFGYEFNFLWFNIKKVI
jgi:hypothetical protein